MDETIPWLCCGCWLLPLAIFGAAVSIVSGIAQGWRVRGLEPGVIYCERCRFDLRGATGYTCSECGASLAGGRGMLVRQVHPPAGVLTRFVFYLLAGTAPAIFILILLGSLLPFNYSAYRDMQVQATVFSDDTNTWSALTINLYAHRESVGLWSSEADTVEFELGDSSPFGSDQTVRVDWRDEDDIVGQWEKITAEAPEITGDADPDDVRDEFIGLVQAIGSGDRPMPQVHGDYFAVNADQYRRQSTHPFYVLFSFLVVVAVFVGLIVLAGKHQAKAHEAHIEKLLSLQRAFEAMVQRNREQMQVGPHQAR